MNPANLIGKKGEDEATLFLIRKEFMILGRNIRKPFGELDIVAKRKDGCLVIFEVKTMRPGELTPEDQMSFSKLTKLKKMAEFYANAHPELIGNKGWQIDLLCLTKSEKIFEIKHYENIV